MHAARIETGQPAPIMHGYGRTPLSAKDTLSLPLRIGDTASSLRR